MDDEKKYGVQYSLAKASELLEMAGVYLKEVNIYVNNMEDAMRQLRRDNEKLQKDINEARAWYSIDELKKRDL